MRIQRIRNNFLLMCVHSMTFSMLACNGKGWWTYTNAVFLSSRRHHLPPKLKLCNNKTTKSRHVNVTIRFFRTSYFPTFDVCSLAAQQHWWCCESRKMAKLMNSSLFVFKISLLRNYRVKYYIIIINKVVQCMRLVCIAGYMYCLNFSFNSEVTEHPCSTAQSIGGQIEKR